MLSHTSFIPTVVLLIASLFCLALAVLPRFAKREGSRQVFRGTEVRHFPPQRSCRGARIRVTAAVLALAALVGAFWRPAITAPTRRPISLPAAATIGPGVGIAVRYADGSGANGCTAGFLVHTSAGQPGLLTAGHCNRPGGPGKAAINYSGTGSYATVGTFTETVVEGNAWEDHDVALIALENNGTIPLTSDIAGVDIVTGVASNAAVGDQLCKFGMRTAKQCGPVVISTASKVAFAAPTACGDSGGPVYAIASDGTATAVGVLVAGSNADDSESNCAAKTRFSVAELIQPWLDKWHLTAVTTPSPATSLPVGPP